ncbi:oligopeptide ABC transporter [Vibrio astriarenae]|nr:oligopeptide ABC transporter [Vibrio sp. C7]
MREDNIQPIEEVKADGEKIVIGTFTDRAELPEVAAILKQQLERNGFQVELDIREYGQIENDMLAGQFDAFILSRATVLDSGDPVAYMQSDFGCAGSFNIGQFCSESVDQALTHADLQPLGQTRQQAIIAAEKAILEQYAAIPLLHERVIQGESLRVKDARRDPAERRLIESKTSVQ